MSRGHIPLRSCIVCNTKASKRELIRLVRTQSGAVEIDNTGKTPGRGAYLCHRETCWDNALKKDRLDHKLKSSISAENRQLLQEQARGIVDTSQTL